MSGRPSIGGAHRDANAVRHSEYFAVSVRDAGRTESGTTTKPSRHRHAEARQVSGQVEPINPARSICVCTRVNVLSVYRTDRAVASGSPDGDSAPLSVDSLEGCTMPIVAALRRLLDRNVEVMVVDGEPGVRVIALSWQGTKTGPSAERTVKTESGNAGLLQALTEIEAELP